MVELLQLMTSKGLCEFDDVIHNMIGAVIGVGVVTLCLKKARRHKEIAKISNIQWTR